MASLLNLSPNGCFYPGAGVVIITNGGGADDDFGIFPICIHFDYRLVVKNI
jgi:hypothetical protein